MHISDMIPVHRTGIAIKKRHDLMSKSLSDAAGVLSVERVLKPRSIAIVGASADPRAFGNFVLQNLERFGYAGEIHLVSRSSQEINGRPCVSSIDALPEGIDLAVLAIPESGVLDAVRTLGARKTGATVIFASGYAEAGDEGRTAWASLTLRQACRSPLRRSRRIRARAEKA
jgi:acyl-CoA synthetase (NDP forming)